MKILLSKLGGRWHTLAKSTIWGLDAEPKRSGVCAQWCCLQWAWSISVSTFRVQASRWIRSSLFFSRWFILWQLHIQNTLRNSSVFGLSSTDLGLMLQFSQKFNSSWMRLISNEWLLKVSLSKQLVQTVLHIRCSVCLYSFFTQSAPALLLCIDDFVLVHGSLMTSHKHQDSPFPLDALAHRWPCPKQTKQRRSQVQGCAKGARRVLSRSRGG